MKKQVLKKGQEQVITSLLVGSSKEEAAKAAGITLAIVEGWFEADSVFLAQLNRRRLDEHNARAERLRSLATDAVEALSGLLTSDNESVRLRAAATVLKTVGLAEVSAPRGKTTAEGVEKDWQHQKFIDSLGAF